MAALSEIKKGVVLDLSGAPHQVIEAQHIKIGRGGAMVRAKLKNLINGRVISKTFKGADTVEPAYLGRKDMQFLYADADSIHLMDTKNYEQVAFPKRAATDQTKFIPEGTNVVALEFKGKIVALEIPAKVSLKVAQTAPGMRGDTTGSAFKPAKLETGTSVQVPLFIKPGDKIVIDTRTGNYVERAK